MQPTRLLLPVFILITALEILGDMASIHWLHYGFKPLIMLLLMAYMLQHRPLMRQYASLRWLFIGMVFALAGDIFLMIPGIDLFAFGLASFLVMQVCYVVAFVRSIREEERSIRLSAVLIQSIPFVLYSSIFLYFLRKPFAENPTLTPLWIPVVVYVVCLSSMGITATIRKGSVLATSFVWVTLGAVLFIISDSVLALNKFLVPVDWSSFLVMSTYAAAQYLIVMGMLRQHA